MVLAAVIVAGGREVSGSCSRFVSVNSSFDGVRWMLDSVTAMSGVLVSGSSDPAKSCGSVGGGGRRSSAIISSVGASTGSSGLGTGTCFGTGGALGFSKSLFHDDTGTFVVVTGSVLGSDLLTADAGAASAEVSFAQSPVAAVSPFVGASHPPIVSVVAAGVSPKPSVDSFAALSVVRVPLACEPALPPRAPRPRSVPLPRPRPSSPPRPRTPLPAVVVSAELAIASFDFDCFLVLSCH